MYGIINFLEKGPNPVHNSKLEALVLKAKSSNMPKDRIENSIKRALRVYNYQLYYTTIYSFYI